MCENKHECPYVKVDCKNHGKCCDCVAAHNAAGSLTYCVNQAMQAKK